MLTSTRLKHPNWTGFCPTVILAIHCHYQFSPFRSLVPISCNKSFTVSCGKMHGKELEKAICTFSYIIFRQLYPFFIFFSKYDINNKHERNTANLLETHRVSSSQPPLETTVTSKLVILGSNLAMEVSIRWLFCLADGVGRWLEDEFPLKGWPIFKGRTVKLRECNHGHNIIQTNRCNFHYMKLKPIFTVWLMNKATGPSDRYSQFKRDLGWWDQFGGFDIPFTQIYTNITMHLKARSV